LVEFASAEETIAAVRNGEADAVLADSGYLAPIVAESNGALIFVGDQIQIGGGVALGMRKSDGALRAKLNAAIESVKSDGSLNKMIAKWFGADAPQF
jgi:polar amino acid transport system substrate-binding protein